MSPTSTTTFHARDVSVGATVSCLIGSALSFIGLIHGETVEWNANGQVSLGYLFLAVVCAAWAAARPAPRVPDDEEIELERLHGVPTRQPSKKPDEAEAPA